MKNSHLFALWGGLFALCAGLGFIPNPERAAKWLMTFLSIACFVPPMMLIHRGQPRTLALIRNLSMLSLGLTVALLIGNFLSITGSETLGNIVYYVLVIVSSPMVCSQYWALSLFLWAYMMIDCMTKLKNRK